MPNFHSPDQPVVVEVTSSSVTLSWSKAKNVTTGLEAHYYYLIRLQADGETEKTIARPTRNTDSLLIEAQLTGLVFNTNYSVSVVPYRQLGEANEGGLATAVIRFKTSCIGVVILIPKN